MSQRTKSRPAAQRRAAPAAVPVGPRPARAFAPALQVLGRVALGGIFIWAGVAKAANIQEGVLAVDAYDVLPGGLVPLVAAALPAVEIVAGVMLVTGVLVRAAAATLAALSLVFLAGMVQAAARGLDISCGCFGGDGTGDGIGAFEIGRDIAFLVVAALLAWRPGTAFQLQSRLPRARRVKRGRRDEVRATALRAVAGIALVAVLSLTVAWYPRGLSGGGGATLPPAGSLLEAGDRVPAFSGEGLFGGTVSWAEFSGEPALIAVWAPWCPSCQEELPLLGSIATGFTGVEIVGVVTALGQHPGPEPATFMNENGLAWPTVVDSDGSIAAALGIEGFPTLFAVDGDGRVTATMVGLQEPAALEAAFVELGAERAGGSG